MKRVIRVAAAAILDGNQILLTRRSPGESMPCGWEFPGGKIEADETPEECVIREIREELSIHISVDSLCTNIQYEYEEFFLDMDVFFCSLVEGQIDLSVHDQFAWVEINKLLKYDLLPADKIVSARILEGECAELNAAQSRQ